MTIQQHIETLRAKPAHIRRRISFWTAFGITAVIFAFWLASFTTAINTPHDVSVATTKVSTPGQSLIAGVGGLFGDIKDMIFGSKKVVYSEIQVAPGK